MRRAVFLIALMLLDVVYSYADGSIYKKLFDGVSINRSETVCMLPSDTVLRIGCTKKCNKHYVSALKQVAKELNYPIQMVTLTQIKQMDYKKLPSQIDAILSPGGHDIDPKYYTKYLSDMQRERTEREFKRLGKTNAKGKSRDRFEYTLFKHYFSDTGYKDIPVLGICYGTQMLASVKGIPLYVDLPENLNIPARRKVNDKIYMNKKSTLFPYIKTQSFRGYKNHHQAIDLEYYNTHRSKYPNTRITATSNNGKVAEVIEFKNRPAVGVQFHPERSNAMIKDAVIRKFLIDACRKVRKDHTVKEIR